jgi:hypothetical protein
MLHGNLVFRLSLIPITLALENLAKPMKEAQ